ncbi:MAG TPA: hypothetical protein EYQ25_10520 [Planctomycetes bacterium]|jgi:hypothetical protein|nr:hypothetical protein [Planctomycetota bacterium]HIL38201.1 hypothetical protein [Planctomycetota bacterium]
MRLLLPLLLLSGPALAQSPISLTISSSQSQWNWTGTSSIGAIVGNPSTNFTLNGNMVMTLGAGVLPISTGQFDSGGVANVFPDLHGMIPNPLPFLPPLATIDVVGLTLEFTSAPFIVNANGTFSTNNVTTALSGTVTVSPLTGGVSVIDLTGLSGDPQALNGQITQAGNTVTLNAPSTGTFSFIDPGTGISADFTISGTLYGSWTNPAPSTYCAAATNSTGMAGTILMTGSTRLQDQNLVLMATQLPVGQFAFFIVAPNQGFVANPGGSQGNICLSGGLGRYNSQVGQVDAFGTFARNLSITSIPVNPPVSAQIGETWYFQAWYRDQNPGTVSNFTEGLAVTFAP